MSKKLTVKITTGQDDSLLLYAELNSAQTRAVDDLTASRNRADMIIITYDAPNDML